MAASNAIAPLAEQFMSAAEIALSQHGELPPEWLQKLWSRSKSPPPPSAALALDMKIAEEKQNESMIKYALAARGQAAELAKVAVACFEVATRGEVK